MAEHNIVAEPASLEAARDVMAKLGGAGIDAGRISLTGPAASAAAFQRDTAAADERALFHVATRVIAFAVVGSVLGAVVGMLIVSLLPGGGSGYEYLLAAVSGAAAIGFVAALVAGAVIMQPGEVWKVTSHDPLADVTYIGVHSDELGEIVAAEEIFRSEGLANVRRFEGR